jgi:Tol biopolymer transport system component
MNLWRVRVNETSGEALGEPEALTTPSSSIGYFSLSRTGRHIAYTATAPPRVNLYKMGFDPSALSVDGDAMAVTRESRIDFFPDASPDGRWLVFMGFFRQWDLYVVGADGEGLRQLTNDSYNDRIPRWSPDGERFAFYSNRSGNFEIWTIQKDGGGLRQITDASGERYIYPAVWSPDGSRLVYRSERAIYLRKLDASRGEPVRVLESPNESFHRFAPHDWSPDGAWLAGHLSDETGDHGIAVYNLRSGELTILTDFGSYPRWLADSRRLVFHGGDETESILYIVDRKNGESRKLYTTKDAAAACVSISKDNRTLYFTRSSIESDIWLLTLG